MKILIIIGLLVNVIFANEYLESIYNNILLKNSESLVQSAKNMQHTIAIKDQKKAQSDFKILIRDWKKVQGFYLLGDYDTSYIDIPRYIDFFHHGNEDLTTQLERITKSTDEVNIALFKNSFKSINALEYILFQHSIKEERIQKIALVIINALTNNFLDIFDGYKEIQQKFINDEPKAHAVMLNSLIETSYKLKEWRIGDVVGKSKKYKNQPNITRGEYYISKNSLYAIVTILEVQNEILGKNSFKNYGSLIEKYGVIEELQDARRYLTNSIAIAKNLDEESFVKDTKLFNETKKLYANYYITLIGKLKIKAKVLDADGD